MKFNSVKEYFYKLNTMGFQLMMIPLILFIIYYSRTIIPVPHLLVFNEQEGRLLFFVACGLSVIVLTAVQIFTKKKSTLIAKEIGLGVKLEQLGTVLINKMAISSVVVLLMPMLLLLTNETYFAVGFGVLMLWYFLQWPTPGRVSKLLKLKGDEREMVITRGDAFR